MTKPAIELNKPKKTDLWFHEAWTDNCRFGMRVRKTLLSKQTAYQQLDVLDTPGFGKVLLLDGLVMVTEKDEFIYHEMITHPAVNNHAAPQSVLIIGGGDGGTAREFCRYPFIEEITVVEIDGEVVDACRTHFPGCARAYDDPRVTVQTADGIAYAAEGRERYDLVVIDSTDPFGPAAGLFTAEFYHHIRRLLREDGIVTAQAESCYFYPEVVAGMTARFREVFGRADLYNASIPTYPSGFWHLLTASRDGRPLCEPAHPKPLDGMGLQYYNHDVHRAAFIQPPFVNAVIKEEG